MAGAAPVRRAPAAGAAWRSRFLQVDGLRTHYLDAGDGPPLVLLHSGEFGACAELSWEALIAELSRHFRVIAPDWLGYGQSAKVHDFEGKRARMVAHLLRFLEILDVGPASFAGNSMGATFLLQLAAQRPTPLRIERLVAISGGGYIPENSARRHLLDYDGTPAAMERLLGALFHDPRWAADPEYLARRHALSVAPGAWEAVAASRFRSPVAPGRPEFGHPDDTPYENIEAPVLLIAGAEDQLRLPGYAADVAARIPQAASVVLPGCGHCANIEKPDEVAVLMTGFLGQARPARPPASG